MIKMDKGLLHIEGRPGLIWAELSAICEEAYNKAKEDIGEGNAKKLLKAAVTLSTMTKEEREELEKKELEEVKERLERLVELL